MFTRPGKIEIWGCQPSHGGCPNDLFESSQVNLLDMLRKSHLRLAQTVHSDLGLWKTHPLEAFQKWHPWQPFSWSCSAPAWQRAIVTLNTSRCHWWTMKRKLWKRRNQRNSSGMLQACFLWSSFKSWSNECKNYSDLVTLSVLYRFFVSVWSQYKQHGWGFSFLGVEFCSCCEVWRGMRLQCRKSMGCTALLWQWLGLQQVQQNLQASSGQTVHSFLDSRLHRLCQKYLQRRHQMQALCRQARKGMVLHQDG